MSTDYPLITVYDAETDTFIAREMTDKEKENYEAGSAIAASGPDPE